MSMMMGGSVGKKEFEGVGVVLLDIGTFISLRQSL